MKKKFLVIGGTGFLGFHLCKSLLKKKNDVSSLTKNKPKKIRNLSKVKYYLGDISQLKTINFLRKKKFHYIINCGGYVDHVNKKLTYNNHYIGTKNLHEIFRKKNIKTFIQIGSCSEYGLIRQPQIESKVGKPLTIYGKSKLKATNFLISKYKKNNFPVVVLRFYQLYGPYQDTNRFISFIINSCINNKNFPCSSGYQHRDFLYIDDAIKAVNKCFDNKKAYGKIFNIGFGKSLQIRKIINLITRKIRKGKPNFGKIPLRIDEPKKIIADVNKSRTILNWKPETSFKKGLEKTINFYKGKI